MIKRDKPHPLPGDEIDGSISWDLSLTIIRSAIAILLTGSFSFLVAVLIGTPHQFMRAIGPVTVALIAAAGWYFRSQGRIQEAINVLAFGTWTAVTAMAIFDGGVHSTVVITYPLIILMIGWLVGSRAAMVVTVVTIIATAGFVLGESRGILPNPMLAKPVYYGIVQAGVFFLSAVLIIQLVHAYQGRMEELTRRAIDLNEQQTELHRAQAVANIGSWVYDFTADTMRSSAENCRIFGLPEGTSGNHDTYQSRVQFQDRSSVDRAWKAALKGDAFDHQHRIVVGQVFRWIRQKAEFEFAADGTPLRAVGTTQDITERKNAEEKIEELAFYDQLTGLPNRTLLLDRLKQTMTISSRNGMYGALLIIDLDNFKTLNDTLGHERGDQLLKQVALRLTNCVRAGDTVARLGGDEFVVMLASLSMDESYAATQTEIVGEKILAALNQTYQIVDVAYHSTSSIGANLFKGHQTEIDDLMKQTELAMYKAKAAGRNTLRFFDPDMEIDVMKRATLEKDLRIAVHEQQFLLHYQAQMAGENLTGAEVLVRWQHPQRSLVSPLEFIPLAEETKLILPLGHWVLETACTQLAVWATRPEMDHLTVAVNVSAHQFRQPDFVEQVLDVLDSTGANPQRLKLELTESLLVEDVEGIIAKMSALKTKGVSFSLDDFGTGFSSLTYLKRLPLDQLKIDQSFVRDILVDSNDAAIAKTIIALAQSLGLGVIAEGVETADQRDFLASSGCHFYQGYFFSKPLPLEGFEAFAQSRL